MTSFRTGGEEREEVRKKGPKCQRMSETGPLDRPLLAPFMAEATLVWIHKQLRTATVMVRTPEAAGVLGHDPNRSALRAYLRCLFGREPKICVTTL